MNRVYNFSPGPSMLPTSVLEKAQAELLDWRGSGMSVMEVSHRGKAFIDLTREFSDRLRRLLSIPDNYRILFLPGGATGQFAAVALNLRQRGSSADYLISGQWSKKATEEANKFLQARIVANTLGELRAPRSEEIQVSPDAAYLHYTPNETIIGVEYPYIPDSGSLPLVGDFSSTLLSRPVDVSRHGVIYACTQKNIGPAGNALVIVREDLLESSAEATPGVLNWSIQNTHDSAWNTPATYNWYLSNLVLEWIEQQGGLAAMAQRNQSKAELLYHFIDHNDWYKNPVQSESRSWMNIPFTLADSELEADFLSEAEASGLTNLKGHRSIGGMRASLYNAMPLEGVEALIAFMTDFARRRG